MSRTFSENRKQLADLIYSMNSFTEPALINEYLSSHQNEDSPAIGGIQTIKEYLNDLTQIGVLNFASGWYTVAEYGENRFA